MNRSVRCLSGLAVVVLLARPGAAQAPNPTAFQITVEDELGGVLVGAKVTLTAVATQQTSEGAADKKAGSLREPRAGRLRARRRVRGSRSSGRKIDQQGRTNR